ncbi:hypothetical protein CBOM_01527 [Ceraceosorus bombacis]|uniref:Uncharacterized protein n=1 Tax=Ceraceosorus bombacis TaxID=401625 RepID=A0A0N7L9F2_9BASI|nr:hypothetical protein CBOM_01527 [Ceraceosorus bombacis]
MSTADVFQDYKWSGDEAYLSVRAKCVHSASDSDSRLVRVPKDHLHRDFELMLQIAAGVYGVAEWQKCALEVRHASGPTSDKRVITSRREWLDFHAYERILRGERPHVHNIAAPYSTGGGFGHYSLDPKKVHYQPVVLVRKPSALSVNDLYESNGTRRIVGATSSAQAAGAASTSSTKTSSKPATNLVQAEMNAGIRDALLADPIFKQALENVRKRSERDTISQNVSTPVSRAAHAKTAGDTSTFKPSSLTAAPAASQPAVPLPATSTAQAPSTVPAISPAVAPVTESVQELIRTSTKLCSEVMGWTRALRDEVRPSTALNGNASLPSAAQDFRRSMDVLIAAAGDIAAAVQLRSVTSGDGSRPPSASASISAPAPPQSAAPSTAHAATVPEQVEAVPTTTQALRPDAKPAQQEADTSAVAHAPWRQGASVEGSGATYEEIMAACRAQGEAQGRAFGEISARRAAKLGLGREEHEHNSTPSNVSDDGFSLVEHEHTGREEQVVSEQARKQHTATKIALGSAAPNVPNEPQSNSLHNKGAKLNNSEPLTITDEIAAHNAYMQDAWQKRLSEMGHVGQPRDERDGALRGSQGFGSQEKKLASKTAKGKERALSPSLAHRKPSPKIEQADDPVPAEQITDSAQQAEVEATNATLANNFDKFLEEMRQARNESRYAPRQPKPSKVQATTAPQAKSPSHQQAVKPEGKDDEVSTQPTKGPKVEGGSAKPNAEPATAPSEMNKHLEDAFAAMLQKAQSTKGPG